MRILAVGMCALILCFCLSGTDCVLGQDAFAAELQPSSPENTTRNFYKFYIDSLKQQVIPIKQKRHAIEKYVTARLLRQIDKEMAGPEGIRSDYFIDAQDYDDEWGDRITVNTLSENNNMVILAVILNGKQIPNHRLQVTLKRVGKIWKIDKVSGKPKVAS